MIVLAPAEPTQLLDSGSCCQASFLSRWGVHVAHPANSRLRLSWEIRLITRRRAESHEFFIKNEDAGTAYSHPSALEVWPAKMGDHSREEAEIDVDRIGA